MKNCSEIGGSLRKGEASVFLQKNMFSLLLEYCFFLFSSGKYSCLL